MVNYNEFHAFLDSVAKVKNLSKVRVSDNGVLSSWSYSSKQGKFKVSKNFPVTFMEELGFTEIGILFFIIYNLLPYNIPGHECYLFQMSMDVMRDGSGQGLSKNTFYKFRKKLLFYNIVFKVNGVKDENGKPMRNVYFFNPRYVDKSKAVICNGAQPPSHSFMSSYGKDKISKKFLKNKFDYADE